MAHGRVNGQAPGNARKKRLERAVLIHRAQIWIGRTLIVAIALLVLIWLGKQAYLFCVARAIRTECAQWSVLTSTYDGQAIVMRNETVVRAPVSGSVTQLVAEGTRVHTGSAVARIAGAVGPEGKQESVDLQSPLAGAICWRFDGWEGIITPASYQRMDLFSLFKSVKKNYQRDPAPEVKSGDPVFKVIDNLVNPYLAIMLDGQPQDLVVGSRVDLSWGASGQGRGKIIGLNSGSGACIAVVEVSQAAQDMSTGRTLDVRLINKKCEGIVLPAAVLVNKGGAQGVYTKSPVGFKFVRVQVVGALGDRVAIQGIRPGTDVVLNPGLLKRIDQEI